MCGYLDRERYVDDNPRLPTRCNAYYLRYSVRAWVIKRRSMSLIAAEAERVHAS